MGTHPFADQVAIVTGAGKGTGGVGRAIALALSEGGARVMVADIDPAVAQNAAEIMAQTGRETLAHVGSLADEDSVKRMVVSTIAAWGRIDILINNAGGGIIRPFLEHDAASFTETIARNLWTAIWCCHKVLPHMVEKNYGRIVNIGADSLRTGIPNHAGYNAAKGGVVGMSVALACDFAAHDITINTVSPCVINTPRFRDMMKSNPALAGKFEQVVPKGRAVEIAEVVDAVCFLARRESGFMTGQELSLNGGSAMP